MEDRTCSTFVPSFTSYGKHKIILCRASSVIREQANLLHQHLIRSSGHGNIASDTPETALAFSVRRMSCIESLKTFRFTSLTARDNLEILNLENRAAPLNSLTGIRSDNLIRCLLLVSKSKSQTQSPSSGWWSPTLGGWTSDWLREKDRSFRAKQSSPSCRSTNRMGKSKRAVAWSSNWGYSL